MKKILLVALMVLCAASLSFAESMAECEEKYQGNANCAEDCTIEKASEQSSDVVSISDKSALPMLGRHSVKPNSRPPRD